MAIMFLLLDLATIAASACTQATNPHEKRTAPVHQEVARSPLPDHVVLPMRVGLKQNPQSLADAETWLMDVSTPGSAIHGRFWTQEQVTEAFAPSEEILRNVTDWLHAEGVTDYTHSDDKLWTAFDTTAGFAASLLKTNYEAHSLADGSIQAACDEYHLSENVKRHVEHLTPGVKGSEITAQHRSLGRRSVGASRMLSRKSQLAQRGAWEGRGPIDTEPL